MRSARAPEMNTLRGIAAMLLISLATVFWCAPLYLIGSVILFTHRFGGREED